MWHVVQDLHHQDDSRPLIWKLPGQRADGVLLDYSEVIVVLVAMRDFLLLLSCQVGADLQCGVACARVCFGMVCLKVILDDVSGRPLAVSEAVAKWLIFIQCMLVKSAMWQAWTSDSAGTMWHLLNTHLLVVASNQKLRTDKLIPEYRVLVCHSLHLSQ